MGLKKRAKGLSPPALAYQEKRGAFRSREGGGKVGEKWRSGEVIVEWEKHEEESLSRAPKPGGDQYKSVRSSGALAAGRRRDGG